jgi:hypothetical protein
MANHACAMCLAARQLSIHRLGVFPARIAPFKRKSAD